MTLRLNPIFGTALTLVICASAFTGAQDAKTQNAKSQSAKSQGAKTQSAKSQGEKAQVEKSTAPLLIECVDLVQGMSPVNLTEKDNGKDVNLKVGDRFSITLPSNPSTGYQLFMLTTGDEPWKFESKQFKSEGKSMPGKGGREQFFFVVTKKGVGRLSIISARVFDLKGTLKEAKPYQVFVTAE
jgi:predicted secreted protein